MSDLFRKQVLQKRSDRLHGDILMLPRLSHSIILLFLFIWVAAVILWLVSSTYARKETVSGWLEPAAGTVRIYGDRPGLIKQVLVSEGDRVVENQALIVVDGSRVLEGGEGLEMVLLNEYRSQKIMLEAQLARREDVFSERLHRLDDRILSVKRSLALLQEEYALQQKSLTLAVGQVTRYRQLRQSGHVSAAEVEAVVGKELQLRERSKGVARQRIDLEEQLQELKLERLLLPDEHANRQGGLTARLSEFSQKVAQLNGQRRYVIRASRAGIVSNLQAREGQRLNDSKPVLSLLSENYTLTAHLLVPVRAAGFLGHGLPLNIRYDAFPYQKFGIYHGGVKEISSSVLLPEELLNSPVTVREPVFRVSANLDHASVRAYGRDFQLKPGMTLSADIRLSERSLLQWLLEPVYSLKGRL